MRRKPDLQAGNHGNGRKASGVGLGAHIRGWMLVVGLVPLVALFAYGYLAARDALIEASDDHLTSVVVARRAQIESWLRERLTDLEVISGSQDCIGLIQQAVAQQEHAGVCRYLGTFQTGARDYQEIALYDLDWNWVASHSGADRHGESILDAEFKQEIKNSQGPVMGLVHQHEHLGTGLHLAGRLRRPEGDTVGYVVAALDLTGTFAPILEDRAGLGRTGRMFLADSTG
ncbi:MAG: cache domain-containing protein, partial [Syntrophales bacterium]|nr:cache domain-containing protein [Syntrophales bacterium]